MLDIKRIREDFENVKKAVESRGQGDFGIDRVLELDKKRRATLAEVEKMKAKVIEAEAEVPMAMAEALKNGNLGVIDYYKLQNVQADTAMKDNIGKTDLTKILQKQQQNDKNK